MARRAAQGAIENVRFNIVSKINAGDVRTILNELQYDFPQTLTENQTVKTPLGYVFQVKRISPENSAYVRDLTTFEISFTRRKLPFNFLLAVDKSFSMKKRFSGEGSKAEAACEGIVEFLERNVGIQSKVGCVSFGLDWELLFEPQQLEDDDLTALKKKLQSIVNTGRATPSAALSAAREIFEGEDEDLLKRLVIFSDGVDRLGQSPLEFVEELQSQTVIVDVIFIGREDDESSLRVLKEITRLTRGQLVIAHDQHDIEDFLSEISQSITIPLMPPRDETGGITGPGEATNEVQQVSEEVHASEGKIEQKDENINKEDRIGTSEIVPTDSEKTEQQTETAAEEEDHTDVPAEDEEPTPEESPEEEEISDVIVIGSQLPEEESEGRDISRREKRFHQTPSLFEWLKTQFLKLKKFFWDTD